jgi:hypothetical protein
MYRIARILLAAAPLPLLVGGVVGGASAAPTFFDPCKATGVAVAASGHKVHGSVRWRCVDSRGRVWAVAPVRVRVAVQRKHVRRFLPDTWDTRASRDTGWVRSAGAVTSAAAACQRGQWRAHATVSARYSEHQFTQTRNAGLTARAC